MHLGTTVNAVTVMLLLSAVVAIVARRLALPYTVGLVAVGAVVGALRHHATHITLTEDLLFTLLLPPLIFEAALQTDWHALRRELSVVMLLATVGVLVSAAIIAGGIVRLAHWPVSAALVTAVLLSATDPVSVIAAFKDSGIGGRLRILVETESLFNDGTAAVLFTVALALAGTQAVHGSNGFGGMAGSFVTTFFGGILCGLVVGGVALLLSRRTEDHLAEITLTTVAAYGSSLLALHFHLSNVLAVTAAGILMGNVGASRAFTDRGRQVVVTVWEFNAFVANSIIFLLIGSALVRIRLASVLMDSVIVIVLTFVARAATVYGLCLPFAWSKHKVSLRHQHLLFWGGLRGALALALVLAVPADFPLRDRMVGVVFVVVGFSVVAQGLTVTGILRRFAGDEPAASDDDSPLGGIPGEAAPLSQAVAAD